MGMKADQQDSKYEREGVRWINTTPTEGQAFAEAVARRIGGDRGTLVAGGFLGMGSRSYEASVFRDATGPRSVQFVSGGKAVVSGFPPQDRYDEAPNDNLWQTDLGRDFSFGDWDAIVAAVEG